MNFEVAVIITPFVSAYFTKIVRRLPDLDRLLMPCRCIAELLFFGCTVSAVFDLRRVVFAFIFIVVNLSATAA